MVSDVMINTVTLPCQNNSSHRVYDSFEKCLPPPTPSSLFSRLLPVQLSKTYQFKITMQGIIPQNIKSFEQKTPPQSF